MRAATAPSRRSYSGALRNRLTNDWLAPATSADTELQGAIATLRARCREAERNDDYIRRYFSLLENNVLGANGIALQMKVSDPNGRLNRNANSAIETAWWKWGKKSTCCVTRQMSWRGLCRLVLRSAKRDGGALVRIVEGYRNEWGFALQPIEIDQLDLDYNGDLSNGNEIRMGVELDPWRAPVAYHLLTGHPGDTFMAWKAHRRERIPVSELLHIFLPDRILQTIGAPAPSATLLRLKMLAGYEEAELVAAREGACKGYGIKRPAPEQFTGEEAAAGELQDIEPGMGLDLRPGEEYFGIDPQHPMDAYPVFVKSILRAVAGGLGISYNSLANDLEGVNYSSLRAGLLDEREEWKGVQQWFIEELCEPVFEAWLSWSLAMGMIRGKSGRPLPADRLDYFHVPTFQARRWPWVDPLKDMQANVLAVEQGFESRRRIIAEGGKDIEDVFQEQSEDEALAEEYGLEFPKPVKAVQAPDSVEEEPPEEPPSSEEPDARLEGESDPDEKQPRKNRGRFCKEAPHFKGQVPTTNI